MTLQEMRVSGRHLAMLALTVSLLLAVIVALFAPKYLAYADNPVKSDAVVLFIGPGFSAREMEAKRLLEGGYADYLLIPSIGMVEKDSSAVVNLRDFHDQLRRFSRSAWEGSPEQEGANAIKQKRRVQSTHIEILEARKMMEKHGFKSALLVSSPYHMRRIKIISESVFADNGNFLLTFVPTRFEKKPDSFLGWCRYAVHAVIPEYLKIMAFRAYSYFGG